MHRAVSATRTQIFAIGRPGHYVDRRVIAIINGLWFGIQYAYQHAIVLGSRENFPIGRPGQGATPGEGLAPQPADHMSSVRIPDDKIFVPSHYQVTAIGRPGQDMRHTPSKIWIAWIDDDSLATIRIPDAHFVLFADRGDAHGRWRPGHVLDLAHMFAVGADIPAGARGPDTNNRFGGRGRVLTIRGPGDGAHHAIMMLVHDHRHQRRGP